MCEPHLTAHSLRTPWSATTAPWPTSQRKSLQPCARAEWIGRLPRRPETRASQEQAADQSTKSSASPPDAEPTEVASAEVLRVRRDPPLMPTAREGSPHRSDGGPKTNRRRRSTEQKEDRRSAGAEVAGSTERREVGAAARREPSGRKLRGAARVPRLCVCARDAPDESGAFIRRCGRGRPMCELLRTGCDEWEGRWPRGCCRSPAPGPAGCMPRVNSVERGNRESRARSPNKAARESGWLRPHRARS